MSRFSDLNKALRDQGALERYRDYVTGQLDRPSRVGTRGRRSDTKLVYLTPFGFDLDASKVLQARVDPTHYTDLSSAINAVAGVAISDAIGSDEVFPYRGFRSARVVWFRNSTYSTSVATSDITGRRYLKYAGDRASCPFGRDNSASTADQYDAFEEIKTDLLTRSGFEINRVSLTREKLSY